MQKNAHPDDERGQSTDEQRPPPSIFKWSDKIPREDVLKITQVPPIQVWLREQRLRYLGHVQRGGETRMTYQVLHSQAENGKRKIGGQPTTFRSAVKDDLKYFGIDMDMWQALAADRRAWRSAVKQGAQIARYKWIADEHAKRATRKAAELQRVDKRAAEGEPVVAPGIDRTSRVEQLIRNLATSNETVTARNPLFHCCNLGLLGLTHSCERVWHSI